MEQNTEPREWTLLSKEMDDMVDIDLNHQEKRHIYSKSCWGEIKLDPYLILQEKYKNKFQVMKDLNVKN